MLEKSKLIFVLLLTIVLALPVHAQDTNPTPQPEQGFIIRWSQEIVYPAGIRFEVTVGLPELQSATLVIQPEDRAEVTIPVDLNTAIFVGGDNPQIEYFWEFPQNNPPLLFRDITFRWQVSAANNQTARIDDQFTFFDARVNWLRDVEIGDNIRLTLPNTVPDNATPIYNRTGIEQFRSDLNQVADLLIVNLGAIPDFNSLIYTGELKPECVTNAQAELVAVNPISKQEMPCDPATAEAILATSGYGLLQSPTTGLETIQMMVVDVLTRQSYGERWTGKNVPEWFQVGLGLFYSPALKSELSTPLAAAARTGSLLRLDDMSVRPVDRQRADLWQAESYGLVVYIASQIGTEGLFRLANIGEAESFDAAYQAALGKSPAVLVGDFGRWLFTDAGLGAFSFTPYQEATFTPTPSRTPTATLTRTATTTLTLTTTPTVTGVLSLTPLPTRTLTRTPTAAPATATPRPAGSLNSPTPTPVPPITPQAQNTLALGVLLFLGGLVLVAIIALLLTRPRR